MDTTWRFPLVGSAIEIVLYDVESQMAHALHEDVAREGLRLQRIFNLYDKESELNKLNTKRALHVSAQLAYVLELAMRYCALAQGVYDITKGKQFLARKRAQPLPTIGCSYRDVRITHDAEGMYVELLHPDCLIDLGSIAKGYIADYLLAYVRELGVSSAFINARGDLAIVGDHLEVVNIEHPITRECVLPFVLENMAVATSGGYRQFVETPKTSHLIGETDVLSATVLAPTLAEADVLATVLFLLGSKRAQSVLAAYACAYLITDTAQIALNGFEKRLLEVQHV